MDERLESVDSDSQRSSIGLNCKALTSLLRTDSACRTRSWDNTEGSGVAVGKEARVTTEDILGDRQMNAAVNAILYCG